MRYLTEAERLSRARWLARERERWLGIELDYGAFSREVVDVDIDDRDRVVLHARAHGESGYCPELAANWAVTAGSDG